MGDITKNFSLAEFWPERYGVCPDIQKVKIGYLCRTILQPLRELCGPITVTSGYRSPEHNRSIGGAPTSDHLYLDDSVCADLRFNEETFLAIDRRMKAIRFLWEKAPHAFGQLILYVDKPHLHVSLPTAKHQSETWVSHTPKGLMSLIDWKGSPEFADKVLRGTFEKYK